MVFTKRTLREQGVGTKRSKRKKDPRRASKGSSPLIAYVNSRLREGNCGGGGISNRRRLAAQYRALPVEEKEVWIHRFRQQQKQAAAATMPTRLGSGSSGSGGSIFFKGKVSSLWQVGDSEWPLGLHELQEVLGQTGLRAVANKLRPLARTGMLVAQPDSNTEEQRTDARLAQPSPECWRVHPGICRTACGALHGAVLQTAAGIDQFIAAAVFKQSLSDLHRRVVRIRVECDSDADGFTWHVYTALHRAQPRCTVFAVLNDVHAVAGPEQGVGVGPAPLRLQFASHDRGEGFLFLTSFELAHVALQRCGVRRVLVQRLTAPLSMIILFRRFRFFGMRVRICRLRQIRFKSPYGG